MDNIRKKNERLKSIDIDQLFKKTKTKPHIYYLPLSEDEVNEKILLREEQNKEKI